MKGFNRHDIKRDACMLTRGQAKQGYDWWWHSFTAYDEKGDPQPFFLEFFVCNPASGGDKPVFGQLPENKARRVKPSYLMIKAGAWGENAVQVHRFFGWKEIDLRFQAPFSVTAGDCFLNETETRGSVSVTPEEAAAHPEYLCGSGEISWDLRIRKVTAYQVGYGAGWLFRTLQAFEMFWHAEGMKSEFEGTITLNGKTYRVSPEDCFGYSDKNWGKNFTSPWVWLSSNDLTSAVTGKRLTDSVFDIGGGCPKIGPIALKRKLLSAFRYEGKPYEFNFSKFWTFTRTKFDCHETDDEIVWHVEQKAIGRRMVTDIRCNKKDMLFVQYEAPDGAKRHNRLWNGGNGAGMVKLYRRGKLVDEVRCEKVGCEYGEYDPE